MDETDSVEAAVAAIVVVTAIHSSSILVINKISVKGKGRMCIAYTYFYGFSRPMVFSLSQASAEEVLRVRKAARRREDDDAVLQAAGEAVLNNDTTTIFLLQNLAIKDLVLDFVRP